MPFYYLALAVAVLCSAGTLYVSQSTLRPRSPGDPRQSAAHGGAWLQCEGAPVAAYVVAGVVAALGGMLLVWFDGRISPGTIGVDRLIDILVIAVIGGLRHPAGPFLGALYFVLLDNFAIDLVGAERFNTVIGLTFLAIVLFSPTASLACGKSSAAPSRSWEGRRGRVSRHYNSACETSRFHSSGRTT